MEKNKIQLGHIIEFRDQHGFYVITNFQPDKGNLTLKNLNNLGAPMVIQWEIFIQLINTIKGHAYNVENYR